MDSEAELLEEKLASLLDHIKAECGIFERMVYKNKNQHRRCSYFQYLLKVRRDLRLLQSTKLEEILSSCFLVITGKRPKQKVHLLESLKRRKCEGGKNNFMERLLGAARLLSQMVEPVLKAAVEISILLARSHFMGFALTIMALLARIRVLIQQILLDVVIVFNMAASLSQKKQSVKLTQGGVEVFREIFPTKEEFATLECVWESDKFVLVERTNKSETVGLDGELERNISLGSSSVQYSSIASFLGDDEPHSERVHEDLTVGQDPTPNMDDKSDMFPAPSIRIDDGKPIEDITRVENVSSFTETSINNSPKGSSIPCSSSSASLNSSKLSSGTRKVAFVSIKNPLPSINSGLGIPSKETEMKKDDKEDSFFSLLTGGNIRETLF